MVLGQALITFGFDFGSNGLKSGSLSCLEVIC
jgi:hypothetical protein